MAANRNSWSKALKDSPPLASHLAIRASMLLAPSVTRRLAPWIRTSELAATKTARSDNRSGCTLRWRDGSTERHRRYALFVQDEGGPKDLLSRSSAYPYPGGSTRTAKHRRSCKQLKTGAHGAAVPSGQKRMRSADDEISPNFVTLWVIACG